MKKAFSLIELSIVILIIGILVAGVTSSSRLVNQMKLTSARAITRSSPVSSIQGLLAWYKTTNESSFDSSVGDQDKIAFWNDTNTQSAFKFNITQSNTANQPAYVQSGIGGLPSINFNNSNLQYDNFILNSNYSIFTVFKRSNVANTVGMDIMALLSGGPTGNAGLLMEIQPSSGAWLGLNRSIRLLHRYPYSAAWGSNENDNYTSLTYPIMENTEYILGYVRNFNNSSGGSATASYINGNNANYVAVLSGYSTYSFNIQSFVGPLTMIVGNLIGANRPFSGMISEIIIFDRALKSDEVIDVQKYLSKKYNIKIS